MKYFNELQKAMSLLAEHPKTIFIIALQSELKLM
jgi:hypothetical protein